MNVEIRDYTYGTPIVVEYAPTESKLVIGKFCSIANNVKIYLCDGTHHSDWMTLYPFPELMEWAAHLKQPGTSKGDVIIGNDVWICDDVTILSGVTIGDGAIIAARAVVTKDVPPYALVAGNPAKVKKYRFTPAVVDHLLKLEWWDWPIERIKKNIETLCGRLW